MTDHKNCPGTLNECHLQNVPCLEGEYEDVGLKSFIKHFKAEFAKPWNLTVKPWMKRRYKSYKRMFPQEKTRVDFASPDLVAENTAAAAVAALPDIKAGDYVRVKSIEEIEATLDSFNELKGCAFLADMYQYCDTTQKVFIKVERFLDERDYKVKTARGLYYLENLFCTGTKVFGRCDRRCFFFWRAEWLEKVEAPLTNDELFGKPVHMVDAEVESIVPARGSD